MNHEIIKVVGTTNTRSTYAKNGDVHFIAKGVAEA